LRRSNRLILLLGFVIAAIAFFGIVLLLQESPAGTTTNTPDELPTVFTKADIPLGTVITSDMLEVKTFPVEQRDPTAFADGSLVVGKLAVTPLAAGKQLVKADFSADAAQAAIAQNLPKGLRAVAGKGDEVAGVGTLINTGDHVDVIATFGNQSFLPNLPANATQVPNEPTADQINANTTKVLLQNLLVVGTLVPQAVTTATGAEVTSGSAPSLSGREQLVLIAVTPQEAELIAFANVEGSITLTLRSPLDYVDATGVPVVPPSVKTTGITLKTLLDDWGVLVPTLQTSAGTVNR
jgi:pilus assembly protein CpaB